MGHGADDSTKVAELDETEVLTDVGDFVDGQEHREITYVAAMVDGALRITVTGAVGAARVFELRATEVREGL